MSYIECPFCNAANYDDDGACEQCGKKMRVGQNGSKTKKRILALMVWILLFIGGMLLLGYLFGTQGELTQEEKWDQDRSWRDNMRRIIEDPATYFH